MRDDLRLPGGMHPMVPLACFMGLWILVFSWLGISNVEAETAPHRPPSARAFPLYQDPPDIAVTPATMANTINLLAYDNSPIAVYLKFRLEHLTTFCDRSNWRRVPWELHQAVMAYFSDPYPISGAVPAREDVMRDWKMSWTCLWDPNTGPK